ncbi:N-acetylglucosamine-6-phosphate deacetylase [Pseudidiomarina sediminum]|uniref:N-acetylglucosamine-6-phosphate deacetylase n=1 Tax=Pseudidiomarina sediminum TaxID=431675 RepID=UPI001C94FF13|nr:N-acetylglucosamine-6-phosphate deacetylase [Pseudidiomarina sediminum]MBY6064101.1 N-acetylglucosamine-6-phosphate deacetylase [Pseudidiomarina sediminum]
MLVCEQVLTRDGWRQHQLITVEHGRVSSIRPAPAQHQYPVYQGRLVPGFIDIQVNGGGGVLFNHSCDVAGLQKMMQAHLAHGTTAMLPTLITDDYATMAKAAAAVRQARQQKVPGIVGVHFEGPWLAAKRKGVHREAFIRPPTAAELDLLTDPELGVVMVTLAPETVAPEVIQRLSHAGVKVFLGHSDATAAQVNAALDAGAIGFTHLYNAMSQLHSRAPGMVGVCLARDAYAGIIVDGYHVDPQACQIAFRAKGKTQMMLVTDAMALAATTQTHTPFFDTEIQRHGDKLTTPDGTLAGSSLTMLEAVKNTVSQCQVPLTDALEMASLTPAKAIALEHEHGAIAEGHYANFMLLDADLSITQLWLHGVATRKEH